MTEWRPVCHTSAQPIRSSRRSWRAAASSAGEIWLPTGLSLGATGTPSCERTSCAKNGWRAMSAIVGFGTQAV
jgi:hypothetical protein